MSSDIIKKLPFIKWRIVAILFVVSCTGSIHSQRLNSNVFKLHEKTATYLKNIERRIYTSNTTIPLDYNANISGLAICGSVEFQENDGYLQVIVQDDKGKEYLVYESYPLLANSNIENFDSIAMESALLDNIRPVNIKIQINKAILSLQQVIVAQSVHRDNISNEINRIRETQENEIISALNNNLKAQGLPWRADRTSVSKLAYDDKRKFFSLFSPCMHGFEYYKGGIYVPAGFHQPNNKGIANNHYEDNRFVDDFDWRNRHGKNWITSVKNIEPYLTCWVFAAVGAVESNFNIYFNRLINYDLSEQNVISCMGNPTYQQLHDRVHKGGSAYNALNYIKSNAITTEACFPFQGVLSCDSCEKCEVPSELVSFNSIISPGLRREYDANMSVAMRKAIIKAPIVVDYFPTMSTGHSMSCVGYHRIRSGETIRIDVYSDDSVYIDNNSEYIGEIAWILKNNWGDEWGENGFCSIIFNSDTIDSHRLTPPFSSLVYSDTDRLVTDVDMDGYYYWGSGSKPQNLPAWIPDQPDGEDSNPCLGAMNVYGVCDTLYQTPAVTWNINSAESYSVTTEYLCPNIEIQQNGTLTITSSTLSMIPGAVIRIKNGGNLIISGGTINDADVIVESGGHLTINNSGTINLSQHGDFETQFGAIVNINSGKINPY